MQTNKIPTVSELLEKDLNDEIVIMQLMSYPQPELVIAGLIKKLKDDRGKFAEQIDAIYKRLSSLELRAKNVTDNISSVNQVMNFMKANVTNMENGTLMNQDKE